MLELLRYNDYYELFKHDYDSHLTTAFELRLENKSHPSTSCGLHNYSDAFSLIISLLFSEQIQHKKEQQYYFNLRPQRVFRFYLESGASCSLTSMQKPRVLSAGKTEVKPFLKIKTWQCADFNHSVITSWSRCCEDLIIDKSSSLCVHCDWERRTRVQSATRKKILKYY